MSVGFKFDFSIALEITAEPSLKAGTFLRVPPRDPIAVLTAEL